MAGVLMTAEKCGGGGVVGEESGAKKVMKRGLRSGNSNSNGHS
jgi:hypothetical protein